DLPRGRGVLGAISDRPGLLADVKRRDLDRRAGPRPRPARDRVGLHRPGDDTARPGMNTGQLGERRGLPGGWKEAAPHRRWLSSRYPCGQVLELCVDEELPEDEDVDDGLEDALGARRGRWPPPTRPACRRAPRHPELASLVSAPCS